MVKSQKALVSFLKFSDALIITMCEFILQCMTGNAFFPAPTPKLVELQALLDSFTAAVVAAESRDRNKIAVKNELRIQLNEMLNQLGNYVNTASQGNLPMLTSSGFKLSKLPQPRYVAPPENIKIKVGINPGTLVIKIKADKAATGYIFMIAPASAKEPIEWTSFSCSRSQYEFTNLEQHTEYMIKVAVVGSKNQVAYSSVVNSYTM